MPRGDGTGPEGKGPKTGRGGLGNRSPMKETGRGAGAGKGRGLGVGPRDGRGGGRGGGGRSGR